MDRERPSQSMPESGTATVSEAYFKHESFLKKFLSRYLSRPQDVDDVAQETFLKAFDAEKKQRIRSPKAFLFHIAKNIALSELSRKSNLISDYIEDISGSDVLYSESPVEDAVAARQMLGVFQEATAILPSQCRRAFLMRKIYGMSHNEISQQLGISVSTVEKHLANGLQRCSQFMQDRGHSTGKVRTLRAKATAAGPNQSISPVEQVVDERRD